MATKLKVKYPVKSSWGKDGFRMTECPMCKRPVYVMTLQDDTRWRYGTHFGTDNATYCGMSKELIPETNP